MSELKNLLEQYAFEAQQMPLGDSGKASVQEGLEKILRQNKKWVGVCLVLLAAVMLSLVGFLLWNLGNPQYLQTMFGAWGVCLGGLFFWLHKLWKERTVAEVALLMVKYPEDKLIVKVMGALGAKL